MDYLEHLNDAQKQAVLHTEGPSMIIAGAGSGKTRVLTYRIAHLIQSGVDPFNILSLTFTNKASKEMRERIEKVVGYEARNIWMGTFHSVFAKILRAEAPRIGYPSNFAIYDTDDAKSLIKSIVKELQLDDKLYKANVVYYKISSAKNNLIGPQEYKNNPIYQADDEASMRPEIGRIYEHYQKRCFKAGAMDFDDLLMNTNKLFKEHIDVLNKYQDRFKYVLIDEFQDTNHCQYLITKKLAARNQNITVVGDDAQSIYAFRGAEIQNILNFEKDYPDIKIFKLEQNYRSTKVIVDAANSIIAKNTAQLPKQVWTSNEDGELIDVLKSSSDGEEGRMVVNSIFEEKMNHQLPNSSFAILYRTNAQSRAFEESLRKMNIPYRIYGGLSFYQRKEIKDLIAYLRFTLNHSDEEALKRIINFPRRGIGATTIAKIAVLASEQELPLWEVLQTSAKYFATRTASAITNFVTLIKHFELIVKNKNAFEAATEIAQSSGIMKELYDDKTVEGIARYENIQELLNAIQEFVDSDENPEKDLGAFLQEISLLTTQDENDDDQEKVTLMTIHSAKGLEFRNVYIAGLEEDLFPSQMMMQTRADLEEERRLFYVATTRAEKKLTFSFATTRYRFGQLKTCEPSRFLQEVDPRFLKVSYERKEKVRSFVPEATNSFTKLNKKIHQVKNTAPRKRLTKQVHTPTKDFAPSDPSLLSSGMKVEHPKFGFGVVKVMDQNGADKKAKIDFDNFGEKTLLLSFAKLRIVEN